MSYCNQVQIYSEVQTLYVDMILQIILLQAIFTGDNGFLTYEKS